jgi:hypothetical protein
MNRRLAAFTLLALSTPLLADVTVRYTWDYKLGFSLPPGAAGQIPAASLAALNRPSEVRIKGNKVYQSLGKYSSITDLTTNEVTYLDPDGRRYGTAQADQIASIIAGAMPQMPPQMQGLADMIKTDVQSKKTGKTEKIQGIQAEEYEIVMNLTLNVPNMPAAGPAMRMVLLMWRAAADDIANNAALKELARYSNLTASSMNPADFLRKLSGPLQGFSQSMSPLIEEMTKGNALVLRTHMEATSPMMAMLAPQALPAGMDPNSPLVSANQDIAEFSTDPVDEAIFKIPDGYTKVDVQEILKDQIAALAGQTK